MENHELPNWHAIVRDYATRKLTYPNDKLKAIAALAELYRIRNKQKYVAGLWMETLVLDLCWISSGDGTGIGLTPRPCEYHAPSWSWAAIDVGTTRELFFDDLVYGSWEEYDCKLEPNATVVDLFLDQIPPNTTYGQIRTASLTSDGLALSTKWSFEDGYQLHPELARGNSLFASRDALEILNPVTKAEWPVVAFVLVKGTATGRIPPDFLFGLFLVEQTAEQYRRVGTFHLDLGSYWDHTHNELVDVGKIFKRRRITIV